MSSKAEIAQWYRVVVSFACYAVGADKDNIIVYSAPIGKKFVGQNIDKLRRWIESKGGKVEELEYNGKR